MILEAFSLQPCIKNYLKRLLWVFESDIGLHVNFSKISLIKVNLDPYFIDLGKGFINYYQ